MKRYTTIHPLLLSFYSRPLYREVGRNWRRISFLYLFLLSAVCLIPITFKVHAQVAAYLSRAAPKIIEQVPVITLSKGTVTVNAPMPHVVKDPDSGAPFLIIDTTGRVTSLQGSGAVALLTQRELILREGPSGTRTFDLSPIENLVVDRKRLYDWTDAFMDSFALVLYPLALLLTFVFRIIQALLLAAVGRFLARGLKVRLPYRSLVSLSIVAMTPSILLNTAYEYSGIRIPFWWLFTFLLSLGYLSFAVRANAEEEPPDTAGRSGQP